MDTSKIQVGDVVHVRATVLSCGFDDVQIQFAETRTRGVSFAYVPALKSSIVHVEPRPLAVGDFATWGPHSPGWKIMAIVGDDAWLQLRHGMDVVRPFTDLVRWEG